MVPRKTTLGFTLVELLVVIAIIVLLAGLVTPAITSARRQSAVNSAEQEIQRMTLALESFQGDFGDFPPTDIEVHYDVGGNGIDSGIESLVAHLATRNRGGPYFDFEDDLLQNRDGDSIEDAALLEKLNWIFGDAQLREYDDPWGNPYVYVHNRDYERVYQVTHQGGKVGPASAGTSEKTATWYSPTTFQIWSAGPNGLNEDGRGDDVVSW